MELKTSIENDNYTSWIYEAYDIQNHNEVITIVPDFNVPTDQWNIGLIYGNSGSGKTTLLRSYNGLCPVTFDSHKALISNFTHLQPQEACKVLASVGLASVPSWLKPYNVLSNGEKFRAEIAMQISQSEGVCFIDEFTSVVDRDVATAMSVAVSKWVRRENKQVVFASCHRDIIEWLQPDWVYSTETGEYEKKKPCCRPTIELQVFRAKYEAWNLFKKHHYLTETLNTSARIYVAALHDKPVACVAVLAQPNGYFQNAYRGSRTVVMPDYQGMGIGSLFSNFIAGSYVQAGYRYFTKTVNPALGEYRNNHPEIWKPTSKNGVYRKDMKGRQKVRMNWTTFARTSYCHEFVGKDFGDINLLKDQI